MSFSVHTAAERPDLWERGIPSASVWPEYNLHGDVLNQWWGHLDEELPDYQFVLYDEARGRGGRRGAHRAAVVGRRRRRRCRDGIDAADRQSSRGRGPASR